MAKPSVQDVIWIFNRATGLVDIVQGGQVLETCTLAEAAQRLAFHRHQAAQAAGVVCVEARATKRARA